MSLDALAFPKGLAMHAWRAMTFRADGMGMPKKPSGAFGAIFMVAMLMAILRHGVATGSMHPAGAGAGFLLIVLVLAYMLGEKRFQCLGMYLCLSSGIDLVAMIVDACGGSVVAWPTLWEGAGLVYGCYRFDQRGQKKPQVGVEREKID